MFELLPLAKLVLGASSALLRADVQTNKRFLSLRAGVDAVVLAPNRLLLIQIYMDAMKIFETFNEVKLAAEPRSDMGQTLVRPRFVVNLHPCLTYTVVCMIRPFDVAETYPFTSRFNLFNQVHSFLF